MDIRVSNRPAAIPSGDAAFVSPETFVEFNKTDGSINLFENGILTPFVALSTLADIGTTKFTLKIPVTSGKIFKIQGGIVNVTANSSTTASFNEAFATRCYGVLATHKSNDPPVSVMASPVDLNTFSVSINGGAGGEDVFWVAFGY